MFFYGRNGRVFWIIRWLVLGRSRYQTECGRNNSVRLFVFDTLPFLSNIRSRERKRLRWQPLIHFRRVFDWFLASSSTGDATIKWARQRQRPESLSSTCQSTLAPILEAQCRQWGLLFYSWASTNGRVFFFKMSRFSGKRKNGLTKYPDKVAPYRKKKKIRMKRKTILSC